MKLRIIITTQCQRNCSYCCNKQFNIDDIPTVTAQQLAEASEVIITGGEPLDDIRFMDKLKYISKYSNDDCKIYLQTAYVSRGHLAEVKEIFKYIHGISITVHTLNDLITLDRDMHSIADLFSNYYNNFSVRIYNMTPLAIFPISTWQVFYRFIKDNCPVAEGEVLVKMLLHPKHGPELRGNPVKLYLSGKSPLVDIREGITPNSTVNVKPVTS